MKGEEKLENWNLVVAQSKNRKNLHIHIDGYNFFV